MSATPTRPVQPIDITLMAIRIGDAAQAMLLTTQHPGQGSPEFRRASRTYHRRMEALRRLAHVLWRQGGTGGLDPERSKEAQNRLGTGELCDEHWEARSAEAGRRLAEARRNGSNDSWWEDR